MSYLAICCVLESLLPGADLVLLLCPGAEEAGHHRESPGQVDAGGGGKDMSSVDSLYIFQNMALYGQDAWVTNQWDKLQRNFRFARDEVFCV